MMTEKKLNSSFNIRPMNRNDISAVAALYRTVAITRENYLEKFTSGPFSFENKGGMFLVHNEESLADLLDQPNETVLIALQDEVLCGIHWYGELYDEAFYGLDFLPQSGWDNNTLLLLAQRGLLGHAKEIIVTPDIPSKTVSILLLLELMRNLKKLEKTHVISEFYRLEGFEDVNGHHTCQMLNMPSYTFHFQTGSTHLGQTPPRTIELDGFCATIHPQVMLWSSADCVQTLEKYCNNISLFC